MRRSSCAGGTYSLRGAGSAARAVLAPARHFRREHVAAAAHRGDDARLRRIRLDLAPETPDLDVDAAIEGLRRAPLAEIEQLIAREHAARPLRQGRKKIE